jgi:hypothetical protein
LIVPEVAGEFNLLFWRTDFEGLKKINKELDRHQSA